VDFQSRFPFLNALLSRGISERDGFVQGLESERVQKEKKQQTKHKLRIPSDPRRVAQACDKWLHKTPLSFEYGAAHEWEASEEELAFWSGLNDSHKATLLERQYARCFLCSLDSEMP
jgi:hypothetical protein